MGKVYIGVMAVRGHKLWGMSGKRVAGSGGLGEWEGSDGRRREVAGRACPAPTGWRKGERVPAGNGQAEGSRPLPTVWGETGCVKQLRAAAESARAGHARPLRG